MLKNQFNQRNRLKKAQKNIFKLGILYIILLKSTLSSRCGLGCLQCKTTNKRCSFCDFKNFYYLNAKTGGCVRQKLENCQLAFDRGNCLLCISPFRPNQSGLCSRVEQTETVENCEIYSRGAACAKCKKGYYLNTKQSKIKIEMKSRKKTQSVNEDETRLNKIQNKKIHHQNVKRQLQNDDSQIQSQKQTCSGSKLIKKENCKVFGENKCLLCDEGYFYNENLNQCIGKIF